MKFRTAAFILLASSTCLADSYKIELNFQPLEKMSLPESKVFCTELYNSLSVQTIYKLSSIQGTPYDCDLNYSASPQLINITMYTNDDIA